MPGHPGQAERVKLMIRFDDVDQAMTQLENMIQMADEIQYKGFLISRAGSEECYIDDRTTKGPEGYYLVKPIADNHRFFWYVCPYCQRIHIESKRLLTHDRPVRMTNCPYRYQINQYVQFDMVADPVAKENPSDQVLKMEWQYMNQYLNSKVCSKGEG